MIIIYYCYGGAHSSVTAAHIHLAHIGRKIPTIRQIINLPLFDQTRNKDLGRPFYIGTDEHNNRIYVLGLGKHRQMALRFIDSLLEYYRVPAGRILLVPTLPAIGIAGKIGGFLSRRLNLPWLGGPLVAWGIRQKWNNLLRIVEETKMQIGGTVDCGAKLSL